MSFYKVQAEELVNGKKNGDSKIIIQCELDNQNKVDLNFSDVYLGYFLYFSADSIKKMDAFVLEDGENMIFSDRTTHTTNIHEKLFKNGVIIEVKTASADVWKYQVTDITQIA